MSKLFVSYNRDDDADSVEALVDDLARGGGHEVWYDKQIPAGQTWWDTILRQIRTCDAFLFVLSDASLSSEACRAELEYAERLGKVRVPIVVQGRRPPNVPRALGTIQEIQYDPDDKFSVLGMIEQVRGLPASPPLPDPLPTPPGVPATYLDNLLGPLDQPTLALSEQRHILLELKAGIAQRRAAGKRMEDLRDALDRLRTHPDVRASIRDDAEELLRSIPTTSGATRERAVDRRQPAPEPAAKTAQPGPAKAEEKSVFYYIGVGFVILVVLAILGGDCGGYAF